MIRKKLQEMTEVLDVAKHPQLLRELSQTHPNTIAVQRSLHRLDRYTCAVYAFDFVERREYVQIAERGPFAGRQFLHWLLDNAVLEEQDERQATDGDFVIYFSDEGGVEHIGLVRGWRRAASKWGIGQLYEHDFFEVPESYGTAVRLFKQLTFEEAFGYFCDYVGSA